METEGRLPSTSTSEQTQESKWNVSLLGLLVITTVAVILLLSMAVVWRKASARNRNSTAGRISKHRPSRPYRETTVRLPSLPSLSPLPPGRVREADFFYAQQTCLWIFFAVPLTVLDEHLQSQSTSNISALGFAPAVFANDATVGYVVLKPMFFTAQYGKQRSGEPGFSFTSDLELAVLVALEPRQQVTGTFSTFLRDPARSAPKVGQYRLGVISDNKIAVDKGRANFGEHKFMGKFLYDYATPNNTSTRRSMTKAPTLVDTLENDMPSFNRVPNAIEFYLDLHVFTWQKPIERPSDERNLICSLTVDLAQGSRQARPELFNWSTELLYSTMPPELPQGNRDSAQIHQTQIHQTRLAGYRFYNTPCQGLAGSASELPPLQLYYGGGEGQEPLEGIPTEQHSEGWAGVFQHSMQTLCRTRWVVAYLLFASPPVEYEPMPIAF